MPRRGALDWDWDWDLRLAGMTDNRVVRWMDGLLGGLMDKEGWRNTRGTPATREVFI